jgi:hypothetical protein
VVSTPVKGNGPYDQTSSMVIKTNKQDVSILDCFARHPKFKIQKWQFADINQKGFDYFIGPYAEDIKCVFNLTFEDDHMYTVDGIALGASIELYHRLVKLEEKVKILEIGDIKLNKGA